MVVVVVSRRFTLFSFIGGMRGLRLQVFVILPHALTFHKDEAKKKRAG